MATYLLKGNAKAEADVQSYLTHLSPEEQEVIQKVLERDRKLQDEISTTLQLSPERSPNIEKNFRFHLHSKDETKINLFCS